MRLQKLRITTYVLHFLGRRYPSNPGLTGKLGMVLRQDLHCIAICVVLARIPEQETTMPHTLTSRETKLDWN